MASIKLGEGFVVLKRNLLLEKAVPEDRIWDA